MKNENLPVSGILSHINDLLLRNVKCLFHRFINKLRIRVVFDVVWMSKILLHLIFDVEWKPVLQESTNLTPISAMTITNWEKVAMLEAHDVRGSYICILISLIWIMSCYSSFGSKWKFGYYVANFLWLGGRGWSFSWRILPSFSIVFLWSSSFLLLHLLL